MIRRTLDARLVRRSLLLLGLTVGAPGALAAQSLLAGSGLGLPAEPLDARSRGVGGSGIGLSGSYLLPTDPAAAAGLFLPSVTASYQPVRATLTDGTSAGHARFPVLGASYPYGGTVFFVQLASYLDQEWSVTSLRTINVSGIPVRATDTFRSSGGIGQARLGVARTFLGAVSVGASIGTYTGTTERTFVRLLNPDDLGSDVEPFVTQGRWRARGTTASAGLSWQPSALVRIAGSALWSGDLDLEPSGGTVVGGSEYAMPLELRAGGTVTLSGGLALSAGMSRADWTETGADLSEPQSTGVAWSWGGGLEWTALTFVGRDLPIRLGARQVDLPFAFAGEAVTESLIAGGFGLHLLEPEGVPLARLEVGIERGTREGGTLSEAFWRTTISLRVAGN